LPHAIHEVVPKLEQEFSSSAYGRQLSHRAFIAWYAQARYGCGPNSGTSLEFLDGSHDGGVDACIRSAHELVVIQSKYSQTSLDSAIPRAWLDAFALAVRHLQGATEAEEFRTWLRSVRSQARKDVYREVRSTSERGGLVSFVFVTTRPCDHSATLPFRTEDRDEISHLWTLFDDALGPPFEELTLVVRQARTQHHEDGKSVHGLTDIAQFLRAMRRAAEQGGHATRLFAQNVRSHLGNTEVNADIVASYRKHPKKFWLYHNGLYVIAPKITKRGDEEFHLTYPCVVNGAQTLWSLYDEIAKDDIVSCDVTVRLLETSKKKLREYVIAATNSQNAMNRAALLAHNDHLPEVVRRLDNHAVFLERQQREWSNEKKLRLQNHEKITVKDLIQWLNASESAEELGSLRSRVKSYLNDKEVDDHLGPVVATKATPAAGRLYVAVLAGLTARHFPKRLPKQLKGKARIASLFVCHCVAQAIGRSPRGIARARHVLREGLYRRHFMPQELVDGLRVILSAAIARQQRSQDDFSNYFKSDDHVEAAVRSVLTPRRKRGLRRTVQEWRASTAP